ncbi:MAG: hypothetical protein ACREOZ_01575 [Gloeomargaritales cyanobacterium]
MSTNLISVHFATHTHKLRHIIVCPQLTLRRLSTPCPQSPTSVAPSHSPLYAFPKTASHRQHLSLPHILPSTPSQKLLSIANICSCLSFSPLRLPKIASHRQHKSETSKKSDNNDTLVVRHGKEEHFKGQWFYTYK